MEWCRARCTILQHENLALVTKRALQSSTGGRPISSVAPGHDANIEPNDELDSAPGWVRHLIAAVEPPKPHSEDRQPRGHSDRRGNSPGRSGSQDRGRRNSPGKGGKDGRDRSLSLSPLARTT